MDIPELSSYPVILTSALALLIYFIWRRSSSSKRLRLPPGPPAWPIVGNLFQLGKHPNKSLLALSLKYGPLMTLRLGMKTTVVVSSPAMAREVLKTHDQVLSGRSVLEVGRTFSHHKSSLIWGYGAHWRYMRRIATVELFSPRRLEALQHLRRDQVFRTIRQTFEKKSEAVNVGHTAFYTSINLLGNMIFSTRLLDPYDPASIGVKEVLWKMMKIGATPNMVDFFPFLRFLDPQGVTRDAAKNLKEVYNFFDSFIQNRIADRSKNLVHKDSEKDFLDVLLDSRSDDFTADNIKVFICDLFLAGGETTTSTIEWAMAEIIRHPDKLHKLYQEMDAVVGRDRRLEESDIARLPYLDAAVKESFRLHATVPLMLPHKAEGSCQIGEYVIPKGTELLVNVWAIGRDPGSWKDPVEFIPERFFEQENSKIEFKGQNFELIPFGAGRRICVGIPLATRMVPLVVGSLLHAFEWKLPDGMKHEQMDMSEEHGVTLKKATDLIAIPIPRLPHHLY